MVGRTNAGGGGGGASAKLKINTYATLSALLADEPDENTIGIVSDTAVTGYYASNSAPTGTLGMVWVQTVYDSAVKIPLDRNSSIYIYVGKINQYVEGAWTQPESRVYQSGWKVTRKYLFEDGDNHGWDYVAGDAAGHLTITGGNIVLKSSIKCIPSKAVDITGYSSLCCDCVITAAGNSKWIGLNRTTSQSYSEPNVISGTFSTSVNRMTIDLTSVTDANYYIDIVAANGTAGTISKIWLEA